MNVQPLLKTALTCAFAVALAGCGSVGDLKSSKSELRELYSALITARGVNDDLAQTELQGDFKALAEESKQKGDTETDNLNAITFYRIGTSAAMYSGDSDLMFTISNDGLTKCAQVQNNRPPTDCGLMTLIPIISGIDSTVDNYNELIRQNNACGGPGCPSRNSIDSLYSTLSNRFGDMNNLRDQLQDSGVSIAFKDNLDQKTREVFCRIQMVYGVYSGHFGGATSIPRSITNNYTSLRNNFDQSGLASC